MVFLFKGMELKRMGGWTILSGRLLLTLLPLILMNLEGTEATQRPIKTVGSSPIVGEDPDDSALPENDEINGVAADATKAAPPDKEEAAPSKPPKKQKIKKKNKKPNVKGKTLKNKKKTAKEKTREKAESKAKVQTAAKEAQRRKKIKEDFSKAEEFHKDWFNMPFPKIKASLENLIKLCKGACTKSQCMDKTVGNNCHLMCPKSTIKECADPLQEPTIETEEATLNEDDEPSTDEMGPLNNPEVSPAITSSIQQADSILKEGNGGGGGGGDEDEEEGEEW
jgi:hypothetical protein